MFLVSFYLLILQIFQFCVDNGRIPVSFAVRSQRVYNFQFLYAGCWIGAEMNHIVQFLKVDESNAQVCLLLITNVQTYFHIRSEKIFTFISSHTSL